MEFSRKLVKKWCSMKLVNNSVTVEDNHLYVSDGYVLAIYPVQSSKKGIINVALLKTWYKTGQKILSEADLDQMVVDAVTIKWKSLPVFAEPESNKCLISKKFLNDAVELTNDNYPCDLSFKKHALVIINGPAEIIAMQIEHW